MSGWFDQIREKAQESTEKKNILAIPIPIPIPIVIAICANIWFGNTTGSIRKKAIWYDGNNGTYHECTMDWWIQFIQIYHILWTKLISKTGIFRIIVTVLPQ